MTEKRITCNDDEFTELCLGLKHNDITKFLLELHKYDPYAVVDLKYENCYHSLVQAFIVTGSPIWAVQTVIDYGNSMYDNFLQDERLDYLLRHACEHKNLELVTLLLDSGFDVNTKDTLGDTVVNHVAAWESPDILRVLIERGANVNHIDYFGGTAVHTAVLNRRLENLKLLVNAGTDLSITDKEGKDGYTRIVNAGYDKYFPGIDFGNMN